MCAIELEKNFSRKTPKYFYPLHANLITHIIIRNRGEIWTYIRNDAVNIFSIYIAYRSGMYLKKSGWNCLVPSRRNQSLIPNFQRFAKRENFLETIRVQFVGQGWLGLTHRFLSLRFRWFHYFFFLSRQRPRSFFLFFFRILVGKKMINVFEMLPKKKRILKTHKPGKSSTEIFFDFGDGKKKIWWKKKREAFLVFSFSFFFLIGVQLNFLKYPPKVFKGLSSWNVSSSKTPLFFLALFFYC